jgi:hypothetical protein
MFRLSDEGRRLLRPTFDQLGFGLDRARFRFRPISASGDPQAYTEGNLVTVDPTEWNASKPFPQLHLLGHEIAHSVQFDRLGYSYTRLRIGLERLWHSPDENYMVPGKLLRLKLGTFGVGDSRFTLEQIAEHIADQIRPPP